ncbi:hypothetical protein ACLK2F_23515 [Escherichia coli]
MAETGATPGAVINADHTITFIALKPGLLTGKARDVTGQLHLTHWGWIGGWQVRRRKFSGFQQNDSSDWLNRVARLRIKAITGGW